MKKRLYSLFEKVDGKWIRLSESAFHKSYAVHVYQSRLISGILTGRIMALRVVKS